MSRETDRWTDDDDRQVAELLSTERVEQANPRAWVAPDDSHETEFDGSLERKRRRFMGTVAIVVVAAIVLPSLIGFLTAVL